MSTIWSFGTVPSVALRDHLLEEQLVRHLHHRAERRRTSVVAAHEAQHREQAHERRDEPARIAMRVDDARVGILGEERGSVER